MSPSDTNSSVSYWPVIGMVIFLIATSFGATWLFNRLVPASQPEWYLTLLGMMLSLIMLSLMFWFLPRRPLWSLAILVLSAVSTLLLHYVSDLAWVPSFMLAPAGSAFLLIWIVGAISGSI